MKSKNETNNPTKEPESPRRRSAIITAGAGVESVGATSQTSAAESATNKNALNMDGATFHSRGIGLASAIALAKEGSNIVLYDVAEDLPGVNYPLARESDLSEKPVKPRKDRIAWCQMFGLQRRCQRPKSYVTSGW